MAQHRPVSVLRDGQKYSASFQVRGEVVVLRSTYGSKRGKIGKLKAKALAEKLLLELAKASGK